MIGKQVPLSTSISSNLIQENFFFCNINPGALVLSSVTALDGLATQSKTQLKLKLIEFETTVKKKLCSILEKLHQGTTEQR